MRIEGLRLEDRGRALPWRRTKVEGVSWLPLWTNQAATEESSAESVRAGTGGTDRRAGACVLIRMEPGRGYRPHRHVGTEDVLVLSGGYRDEGGEYVQGDHVHYEAGSSHAPVALGDIDREEGPDNPACVLFSSVPDGIELL